jgi:hypothetical protein
VNDVLSSMHKDAGEAGEVKSAEGEFLLRVDGGATVNNLLMQIQVKKCVYSPSEVAFHLKKYCTGIYLFVVSFTFKQVATYSKKKQIVT